MTEAVIDTLVFDEIADLMGDAISEFIGVYLDNSPKLLEGIGSALPAGDIDSVISNAHQLKGGSGSIGAMQVFQYAKQLEDGAREGSLDNLSVLFEELKVAYKLVDAELRLHL